MSEQDLGSYIHSQIKNLTQAEAEIDRLTRERDEARAVVRLVDDEVRAHLRSDAIATSLIRPHAVAAVRKLINEQSAPTFIDVNKCVTSDVVPPGTVNDQ